MGAEQLPLDIVLAVRNETRAGMASAIQELRAFREETNKLGAGVPSLVNMMTTLTRIGVVTRGLRTGLELVTATVRFMKGDFDGVWTVLQRLPFGVGEVVREVHDLWNEFSGAREEAERIQAAVDATNRLRSSAASAAESRVISPIREIDKLERDRTERVNQILSDLANVEAAPVPEHLKPQAPFIDPSVGLGEQTPALKAYADQITKIREAQREREIQEQRELAQQAIKDINESTDEQIEALWAAERKKVNAAMDAEQKAGKEIEKQRAKQRQEELEEEERFNDRLIQAKEDTIDKELMAAGNRAEVERRAIRKQFEDLRAGTSAEQRKMLDDLERRQLASVKEDEKEKKKKEVESNTTAVLVSNEFLGLSARRKEAETLQQKVVAVTQAVKTMGEQVKEAIDKIGSKLPRGVVI